MANTEHSASHRAGWPTAQFTFAHISFHRLVFWMEFPEKRGKKEKDLYKVQHPDQKTVTDRIICAQSKTERRSWGLTEDKYLRGWECLLSLIVRHEIRMLSVQIWRTRFTNLGLYNSETKTKKHLNCHSVWKWFAVAKFDHISISHACCILWIITT